jgi:putative transposase
LYLAVVIDLVSRQVMGFAMHERMTRQLAIDALRMAWFRRRPAAGLIFHSDRGSQYASGDFQKQLKAFGMFGSMSRKGDCCDNAVTETLFGSLKVERLHGLRFATRRAAKDEVMDWFQFYNHRRLHSTLGYLSPMNFEKAKANERKGLGEEGRKAA